MGGCRTFCLERRCQQKRAVLGRGGPPASGAKSAQGPFLSVSRYGDRLLDEIFSHRLLSSRRNSLGSASPRLRDAKLGSTGLEELPYATAICVGLKLLSKLGSLINEWRDQAKILSKIVESSRMVSGYPLRQSFARSARAQAGERHWRRRSLILSSVPLRYGLKTIKQKPRLSQPYPRCQRRVPRSREPALQHCTTRHLDINRGEPDRRSLKRRRLRPLRVQRPLITIETGNTAG